MRCARIALSACGTGVTQSIYTGGRAGDPGAGPVVLVFEKPFGLPICCRLPVPTGETIEWVNCPCCCLLPSVTTKTPEGVVLGSSQVPCRLPLAPTLLTLWESENPDEIDQLGRAHNPTSD